jgi:acylphosphatase
MPAVRYDIIFTGRVQGVNFRWTTARVAEGFAVAGWVRNEPDGSVRCVAEGEREELDRFVEALQDAMAGYVRGTEIRDGPASGEFRGFTIRR